MSRKASVTKLKRKPLHQDLTSDDDEPLSKVVKKTNDDGAKKRIKKKIEKPKTVRAPKRENSRPVRKKFAVLTIDDFIPKQKCDLILSCGNGDTGQLGQGEDVTTCKKPKLIRTFVPTVSEFLQIAAGGMHSAVLTAQHEVYTCGCNDEGALGRECFEDDDEGKREDDQDFKMRPVIFEDDLIEKHGPVVQISVGDSHTAALTMKGSVFFWGTFRDKSGCLGASLNDSGHGVVSKSVRPVLLLSHEKHRIVKISSGFNHLAMLSKDGVVLTFGAGDAGQLGRLGAHKRDSTVSFRTKNTMLTPREVGVRTKAKFVDLWCTGYCCFAKATDDTIYVWGLNNYFQLGYVPNDSEQLDVHQPIPSKQFSSAKKWTQFVGDHHILTLTNDGEVYVIGRGDDSRLGLENDDNDKQIHDQQILTRLNGINGENVDGVAASNSTSFAWTRDGVAYAWGFNHEGELGLGVDDDECVKRPMKLVAKSLEGCKIVQISAGGQHTIFMARKVPEEIGAGNLPTNGSD